MVQFPVFNRTFTKHCAFKRWGAWVAQLVKRPTLAQVMISWLVSSSPTLGSVLTAQSLEPALILCLPLSLCPSPARALSLYFSKINIKKIKSK